MKIKNDTYMDFQVCYDEEKVMLLCYEEKEIPYKPAVSEITVSEYYEKPVTLKEKFFAFLIFPLIGLFANEEPLTMRGFFKFPVRFKIDGSDVTLAESIKAFETCVLKVADTEESGELIITKKEIERQKKLYYYEILRRSSPLVFLLCIAVIAVVKHAFEVAAALGVVVILALVFVLLLNSFSRRNRKTLEELYKRII